MNGCVCLGDVTERRWGPEMPIETGPFRRFYKGLDGLAPVQTGHARQDFSGFQYCTSVAERHTGLGGCERLF